ncbi:hypothetical protein [Thalassotalea fusca]
MKLNNFLNFLIVLFTLVAFPAIAQNNSGKSNVSYYKIDASRIVVYSLTPTKFLDNANCNGTNEANAVAVSTERENFAELYASIMLAHANNKKIAFWLDGACTPSMAGGPFPTASMVYVH